MLSINPSELTHQKLHEYLLSAVAPRPIAFVSTIDKNGTVNLAPFSFFNCFGSNPPVLVFSPARSGRTGATKNTHDNVQEVKECVVNIPHYDMLYQMNLAAHMYEKGVNEFSKSGLTPVASVVVKPPRVGECFVQFECEVKDVIETGQGGGAGNLVVCEVKMIHINEKVLNEEGSIDPTKMNYIARMGKQFWARVGAENIISVPGFKMANELGVGWDALPESIIQSRYLSANEVAQIASLHSFPTKEEIDELRKADFVQEIFAEHKNDTQALKKALHLRAKIEIERGSLPLAFQLLMLLEF
ncbi:MAG: flavin reductase family protein [Chitinophagales bacterium]|nr:flavin reductase family protein [Chitinophagales bacterium]